MIRKRMGQSVEAERVLKIDIDIRYITLVGWRA